ncbi:hypothetical protein LP7551_01606 [Roseibium album]|nr:hypothetical protein LP7551_01606 [Roseibium album]
MRITAPIFRFCILVGIPFPSLVSASEPVPQVKPLSLQDHTSFLEGVDLPRAKPHVSAVNYSNEKATSALSPTCEIPRAIFSQVLPFDGERDGDAACGIADPIELTGFQQEGSKARFTAPVTLSCSFAKVLTDWLIDDVLPAAGDLFDSPVSVLSSGPGYQCRRRNNQPDGKLSEHALGEAIDISGFRLDDGSQISIEKDWGTDTVKGRFLSAIHASACKRFSTVLGPDADPNHKSHYHLDTGCHGKTCTYLICQ